MDIERLCRDAKTASRKLALTPARQRNAALSVLADWLKAKQGEIIDANRLDIADGRQAGLSDALIDRLTLNPERIQGMASDLGTVIGLPDPLGEVFEEQTLDNGLRLRKQRVPLGVLAVIYESRPT
jgi:glutamate-5-semialdehyde dehydrogenase